MDASKRDRCVLFSKALSRATAKSCKDIAVDVSSSLDISVDKNVFQESFAAKLKSSASEMQASILEEYKVFEKLAELDRMQAAASASGATTEWRPTGNATKDLRPHAEQACKINFGRVKELCDKESNEVAALEKQLAELVSQQESLCDAITSECPSQASKYSVLAQQLLKYPAADNNDSQMDV